MRKQVKKIHLIKLAIILSFLALYLGFSAKLLPDTTVTGQTGIAAPTGLTASDNVYNNKVGLYWDTIRGATNYRIFRNTVNNSATAADVGVTQANSFLDSTATPGQTFFYWVRAENGTVQSEMSVPDQGTRSATNPVGPVPPLEAPPVPPGNPITATKTYLGKVLFWDEQLSSTRTVSCGTCHHADTGGTDPRSRAVAPLSQTNAGPDNLFNTADDIRGSAGVPLNNADGTYARSTLFGLNDQVTGRRSVSYLNAGYAPILFWDGRASNVFRDPITNAIVLNNGGALESQAVGPPLSDAEMAHTGRDWNDVANRVATSKPLALAPSMPAPLSTWINGRTYPELFQEAFGTADVTPSRIALAIATFERTLYTDRAPVDTAAAGITVLTAAEQRGRGVFNASSCNVCHAGNLFTDNSFRYIGVRPANEDTGRFQVTGNTNDIGSFRVPSLRNVELRGSYFHNGRFSTLEEVVAFYNRGGDFTAPNKPVGLIRPLGLPPQQQADLVAFLRRPLTDPRAVAENERFDRPALYMESSRVPEITGTGVAGSGGFTPQVRAISPPIVGNPNFTVSVASALGNTQAVLVINDTDPGTGTAPASGSFARVTANLANTGAGNGWGSVSLPIADNAALVGRTFTGRWYVPDPAAANGTAVSQAFRFTVFGEATAVASAKFVDFDGDRKTDVSVFRPASGDWFVSNSSDDSFTGLHFGIGTDNVVPADYDGDGKTDIAVFRNGAWYLQQSRDGFAAITFGSPGDLPQPGDYDGDGKADAAVYRPSDSTWYILQSRDGFTGARFGIGTDRPVASDYDGDGKYDIAVYRDGWWYILQSRDGFTGWQFGIAEDKPVQGDYDGDGKSDSAVYRPSTGSWFYLRSTDGGFNGVNFGIATDIPSPGDYDGDGKNDFSVFRPSEGNWYIMQSASGALRGQHFGADGDIPAPSAFVR